MYLLILSLVNTVDCFTLMAAGQWVSNRWYPYQCVLNRYPNKRLEVMFHRKVSTINAADCFLIVLLSYLLCLVIYYLLVTLAFLNISKLLLC